MLVNLTLTMPAPTTEVSGLKTEECKCAILIEWLFSRKSQPRVARNVVDYKNNWPILIKNSILFLRLAVFFSCFENIFPTAVDVNVYWVSLRVCDTNERGWRTHWRPPHIQIVTRVKRAFDEPQTVVLRSEFLFHASNCSICNIVSKVKQYFVQFIYIFCGIKNFLFSESILRFLTSFRVFGYWRRFVFSFFQGTNSKMIAKGVNMKCQSLLSFHVHFRGWFANRKLLFLL